MDTELIIVSTTEPQYVKRKYRCSHCHGVLSLIVIPAPASEAAATSRQPKLAVDDPEHEL